MKVNKLERSTLVEAVEKDLLENGSYIFEIPEESGEGAQCSLVEWAYIDEHGYALWQMHGNDCRFSIYSQSYRTLGWHRTSPEEVIAVTELIIKVINDETKKQYPTSDVKFEINNTKKHIVVRFK